MSTKWRRTRPLLEPAHERLEAVDVHGLVEAVAHRLAHEQVVGDLGRAGRRVVLAGGEVREHGGHQVVRLHALDVERVEPAALAAQHGERPVEVPPPAGGEHRAAQHGLGDGVLHVVGAKEGGHVLERERVLRARATAATASLLAAACSSKSKFRQNFLRSPRPSARLTLRPERGVDDELHPAGLVEEPLEHDVVVGGQHAAQRGPAGGR